MMSEYITKDDLRQFGLVMMNDFRKIIEESKKEENSKPILEWLKSRAVRKLLDISAGSLQNLRVTGKIRFKKVLGSYYYSRVDIMNLFNDK
jgi:putative sterol carrier protein